MTRHQHHSGALPAGRWLALARRPGGLFRGLPGDDSNPAFIFALIFFVLAMGIVIAGYFYYRYNERQFRAGAEHQLLAIAELKVGELAQWRKERMADGGILFKNASFSALVRRFLEKPEDPDAQQQVRSWIDKYKAHFQYGEIRLLDTQGVTRISSPAGLPALSSAVAEHASEVRRSGQVALQDFYRTESDQKIRLAIMVPILDAADGDRPLGVLALQIEPEEYLYPFIVRWPVPSETAETLLLRREGNDVLYLNELRHQTNTAFALRVPLTRTEVPAVRVALGQTGIMTGVDYRGVPVLAAALAVPDSPWFIISKRDLTEINAPLRERLWQIVVMIGILLFGAGGGVGLVWRQQRVRFYRERAKSAEALQKSQDLLIQAEKMGKVGGWEFDIDNRLLTWTKTVYDIHELDITGQQTVDQGINLYTPASRPVIERAVQRAIEQGEPFDLELEIITAKGNLRSVHVIGKADLARRKVSGFFQDITERKQAETALQVSEERHRTILQTAMDGLWLVDLQGRLLEVNDAYCRMSGYSAPELLAMRISDLEANQTDEEVASNIQKVMAEGEVRFETRHRRKDGNLIDVALGIQYRPAEGGQLVIFLHDITGRKQTEKVLLQSRRAALNMMRDAVASRDRSEQMSKELALNSQRIQAQLQLNQMTDATLQEIMDFALEEAVRMTQSTIGYLAFLNEDESVLTMHAWSKSAMAECAISDKPIIYPVVTTGLWGEAVRQRRPVFTNDYATTNPLKKGYPQGHVAVKRHMNVPVFDGTRIVLVAGVGNKAEEYNESDAKQLLLLMEGMWRLIERKRVEEALQGSEARLSTIFENDPTGIFIVNEKTRIIYDVNDSALEVIGLPKGDVVGKVCHRFLCPAEMGCCPICDLGQAVDRSERVLLKPDGTRVPILKSVVSIKLKGENYFLESFIDITERKQAGEALKQSEEKYRNLFDNAMEGVFQTTPEGRLKSANMALARMYSYNSPEEMINATTDLASQMYANPNDREIAVGIFKEKGYIKDFECQMRRKDGSIFWARYDGQFTKTEDGIPCFQGFVIDITDRKQAEEELRRHREHLEVMVAERTAELNAVNRELEAFSYSVSHDLRAPLRSVDGYAKMIEEDYAERLDDEGRRLLQVIRDSAREMGQLISDLLAFSRLSRKELKMGRIGMSELVEDVRRQVEQAETGRAIRWDLGELPTAFGDKATIHVVLINLLANAVKYTRTRREAAIGISGRLEGDAAVYSVTDNGAGFDMAYKDKLFGVFQRLHTTAEFEGTGIGLALVQRIVHRHGGRVWAEGKVNEGATFYFTLPCQKNEEDEMGTVEKEEETT